MLVHGAFAESASWSTVIEQLRSRGHEVVAAANPLRSLAVDAAYVRDVISGIGKPVVLVAHSYGGMVITEAAAHNDAVVGLVYVNGFAPEHGESAFQLGAMFPGSTLADAASAYPVSTGGNEFAIRQDAFHQQFAADVPAAQAAVMGATQRPATEGALSEPLPTDAPAWQHVPSWFVFGDQDLIIPVALHRFMAERSSAGQARARRGIARPERVGARGRHRDDPRGHRLHVMDRCTRQPRACRRHDLPDADRVLVHIEPQVDRLRVQTLHGPAPFRCGFFRWTGG